MQGLFFGVMYFATFVVGGFLSVGLPFLGPALVGWFCADSTLTIEQVLDRLIPFGVGLVLGLLFMPTALKLLFLWKALSALVGVIAFVGTYFHGNLQKA